MIKTQYFFRPFRCLLRNHINLRRSLIIAIKASITAVDLYKTSSAAQTNSRKKDKGTEGEHVYEHQTQVNMPRQPVEMSQK